MSVLGIVTVSCVHPLPRGHHYFEALSCLLYYFFMSSSFDFLRLPASVPSSLAPGFLSLPTDLILLDQQVCVTVACRRQENITLEQCSTVVF